MIPVAEAAKPRKVAVGTADGGTALEAESSDAQAA
jgi:hypothetical protein